MIQNAQNAQNATAGQQSAAVETLVDHLFREKAGQMVSYLARLLGPEHLELAEEVVQDALVKALQRWPYSGIPENPGGWLFQVARNSALDAVRHHSLLHEKAPELKAEIARADRSSALPELETEIRDDELRMLFMCCHPRLSRNSSIPLSLKMVGGFGVREIARSLLADETTIAQRLVRAKRQIREEKISLELPRDAELPSRLDLVLETIYLIFNEGYAASSGDDLVRVDLCREAIRLGMLVADSSLATPKCHALVALMAFQAARFPARVNDKGELVLLGDQDRTLWDRNLIALAFHHFSQSAEGEELSEYHVQAAIAAIHACLDGTATDWKTILELYDQLVAINPSPIVLLNRAVALGKVHGADSALKETEPLQSDSRLKNYYLLSAVRGKLFLEIGETGPAAACFRAALECPCSEPEKRLLMRRLEECG